ncbi:MAG: MoaD/ThiS family protein [Acidimicrobiales bacterium]
MIRVRLPAHLRTLAQVPSEIELDVPCRPDGVITQGSVLDELELAYPVLRGTMRDQVTHARRKFVRFFACEEDLSHRPADSPLPPAVVEGAEPFVVLGAMAGG